MSAQPPVIPDAASSELKSLFKDRVSIQLFRVLDDYLRLVNETNDRKDKMDFLKWGARIAEFEPKVNDLSDLPTIAITFQFSGSQEASHMNGAVIDMEPAPVIDEEPEPVAIEDDTPFSREPTFTFDMDALVDDE